MTNEQKIIYLIVTAQAVFKEDYYVKFDYEDGNMWLIIKTKKTPEETQKLSDVLTMIMVQLGVRDFNFNMEFITPNPKIKDI